MVSKLVTHLRLNLLSYTPVLLVFYPLDHRQLTREIRVCGSLACSPASHKIRLPAEHVAHSGL